MYLKINYNYIMEEVEEQIKYHQNNIEKLNKQFKEKIMNHLNKF